MYTKPYVFNVYKPVGMTSHDVVRYFKRNLPQGFGKIGHFGTLDPFAEGVLMIGVKGAQRLNDYVHEYLPKTYQALGILGTETETGDTTGTIVQKDETDYFFKEIAKLPQSFLEEAFQKKFVGEYLQSPHYFSAAKHEGRPLYEWAREGIKIKKEPKKREIFSLKVLEVNFPKVLFEVTVSSGTYVRTLFNDMAKLVGTVGTLEKLKRTAVGSVKVQEALLEKNWPKRGESWDIDKESIYLEEAIPFKKIELNADQVNFFRHGRELDISLDTDKPIWIKNADDIIGVGVVKGDKIQPKINFSNS